MMAIMHVFAKFWQYLEGRKFVVKTDHNNLSNLFLQKELNDNKKKWVIKVKAYEFDIDNKRGKWM